MLKYETLDDELFGSSDDDWDDTQTTQETSQLTCNSPLSTDSEPTSYDDNFINNDDEEFNLTDCDDEASNHRRVDQNRSPSPINRRLEHIARRYAGHSISSSSSTSSSTTFSSSSKKRDNC